MATEDATNAKTETITTASSAGVDIDAVKERLSFFFSSANVRQDAFLRKFLTSSSSSNKNPRNRRNNVNPQDESPHADMVPIATLLRFNTLSKITKDASIVAKAAESLSDMIVLSEDQTAIGLKKPWTEEQMDENLPLTLVVENLPLVEVSTTEIKDEDKKDETTTTESSIPKMQYLCTTEQVKELFAQYGKVALCRLRFRKNYSKSNDRKRFTQEPLKMAFVEFATQEDCDTAAADTITVKDGVAMEPKRKLTLGETTLTVRSLADYVQERKAIKEQGGEDDGRNKRNRDDHGEDEDNADAAPAFTMEWKPGCVIRLEGLPDECDRETLLAAVSQGLDMTVDQVKDLKIYVDYSRGQAGGAIRFLEADLVAGLCFKLASGDVTVGSAKVASAKVLKGDEEKKYWEDFIAFKNKQMSHKKEEKFYRKKKHYRR
ncbi:hypothetical protein MPSEU_000369100 [Mayamaea pseudoterrestris]|nr:hypothetical protein MPSEU_000369100 [Mayamaea pseudoterrestris]